MSSIKYRQRLKEPFCRDGGDKFHYWGYIDRGFNGPMGPNMVEAGSKDEAFTGIVDRLGNEIYAGDIIHVDGRGWKWVVEYGYFGDLHKLYVSNQLNSGRLVIADIDDWHYIHPERGYEPVPHFVAIKEKIEMIVVGNLHES
jgi:hypothetical protein